MEDYNIKNAQLQVMTVAQGQHYVVCLWPGYETVRTDFSGNVF
jgi:hypothetical protein